MAERAFKSAEDLLHFTEACYPGRIEAIQPLYERQKRNYHLLLAYAQRKYPQPFIC